jgi:glycogen phosphorylase
MRTIRKFRVIPSLPPKLEPLRKLAQNLFWCWSHDAILLFQRLDRDLWESTEHNPIRMLGMLKQDRLDEVAEDEGFLSHMHRAEQEFERYLKSPGWFHRAHPDDAARIAYFSAEYGFTESLAIYSGGLGLLAGDHVKSSSDLGLPLVAVGLLYRLGYFRQYLNIDGWQQELNPENDFYNLPLEVVRGDDGRPVKIAVEMPGRTLRAQVWRLNVGRVPCYLLDTNLEENSTEDRETTAQLYGGDLEMRIRQEILLGIGGQRMLEALGIEASVCHMNEGHSAFQALERIRRVMVRHGLGFNQARLATAAGNIFTTHTPVPAGNDMFPPNLVEKYLGAYWPQLGLDRERFLALGRIRPDDAHEPFCMTVLAIRLAAYTNGVSLLHGAVSRKMWSGIWPEVPLDEIPIGSITNGVHLQSWISRDMAALFDRYLGPRWREFGHGVQTKRPFQGGAPTPAPGGPRIEARGVEAASDREAIDRVWKRVESIPDEELWRIHERLRARLVSFCRSQLHKQLVQRGSPQSEIESSTEALDPEALTIGFARRFATYKRATLLFRDLNRLKRILEDAKRPVQIIIAGKAHPRDAAGKELIRQVIHLARDPLLRRRVVFVEDYSIAVARRLVQGVDVWLNTPRRPMEASGTSGMKVGPNGGLNLSCLDGWWPEAVRGDNGWSVGQGEDYTDNGYQDEVESHALYDLLEKEVVPLFYDRTENDLPKGWIAAMKASIRTICPVFNTDRMVNQYTERFYLSASAKARSLEADNFRRARELATWFERVERAWPEVALKQMETSTVQDLVVGSALRVTSTVHLGRSLHPEDVEVQLYTGHLDSQGQLLQGVAIPMGEDDLGGPKGEGDFEYRGGIPCRSSGQHGYAVRVLPSHTDMFQPIIPSLIKWG